MRAVTSSSSACAASSTGVLTPSSTRPPSDAGAVAARADRHAVLVPTAAGPGDAPRGHDLTGDDAGQHLGPQLGRTAAGDRVGDDVGGHERSGRDQPAHLLGHDHEVDDALTREAAATVVLGHEERRPAELGASRPPGAVEAVGVVGQRAHRGERRLLLEELARRLLEELLVFGEAEVHRRRA